MTNDPKQPAGLKLMTVFIFVLALHVVVIAGCTAYHVFFTKPDPTAQAQR